MALDKLSMYVENVKVLSFLRNGSFVVYWMFLQSISVVESLASCGIVYGMAIIQTDLQRELKHGLKSTVSSGKSINSGCGKSLFV